MLEVRPVSRDVIDTWPVEEAGLPVRVVNSVTPQDVHTLAELRTWSDTDLLRLRSLGRISLTHIHSFFRLCRRIEDGQQRFQHIDEVFEIFLDKAEVNVVSARYGFDKGPLTASRSCATLQEIGIQQNKTRERIRQVEETAKHKLRSRLATVCLQPFFDYFLTFLNDRGKAASCSDMTSLRDEDVLAQHNPCSILLLLADLQPDRITFYNDFFTTLPQNTVGDVEQQLVASLQHGEEPIALTTICEQIARIPGAYSDDETRRMAQVILDHNMDTAATTDTRYFLYERGIHAFIIEILQRMNRPAHYRAITNTMNDHLKPRSRKGAGFVLETLNANAKCYRVERGVYDLVAGAEGAAAAPSD